MMKEGGEVGGARLELLNTVKVVTLAICLKQKHPNGLLKKYSITPFNYVLNVTAVCSDIMNDTGCCGKIPAPGLNQNSRPQLR